MIVLMAATDHDVVMMERREDAESSRQLKWDEMRRMMAQRMDLDFNLNVTGRLYFFAALNFN